MCAPLVIAVTAVWSVKYLNQAMMCFGSNVVVPVYYCTFTFFSVVGASVVYDEMDCVSLAGGLMFGGGRSAPSSASSSSTRANARRGRAGAAAVVPLGRTRRTPRRCHLRVARDGPSLDDEEVELWLVDSDERAVRAFAAVRTSGASNLRRASPAGCSRSGVAARAAARLVARRRRAPAVLAAAGAAAEDVPAATGGRAEPTWTPRGCATMRRRRRRHARRGDRDRGGLATPRPERRPRLR